MGSCLDLFRARPHARALIALVALILWPALGAFAAQPNHSIEFAPFGPGTYPVGCSNLALDSTRLAQLGVPSEDYLNGADGHYVSDILLEPADVPVARPRVPDDELYPQRRNSVVEFVVIACYPTDATNTRPDYLLPDGQRIPRMQRLGQAPIVAAQPCAAIFPPPQNCGR